MSLRDEFDELSDRVRAIEDDDDGTISDLKRRLDDLESETGDLRKRIEELEDKADEDDRDDPDAPEPDSEALLADIEESVQAIVDNARSEIGKAVGKMCEAVQKDTAATRKAADQACLEVGRLVSSASQSKRFAEFLRNWQMPQPGRDRFDKHGTETWKAVKEELMLIADQVEGRRWT